MGSSCRMAPFNPMTRPPAASYRQYGTSIPASNSSELTLTVPVIVTDFCSSRTAPHLSTWTIPVQPQQSRSALIPTERSSANTPLAAIPMDLSQSHDEQLKKGRLSHSRHSQIDASCSAFTRRVL